MRKEQWINIRGLAILSVIIIHTTTMRFNSSSMLNNWINLFLIKFLDLRFLYFSCPQDLV